MSRRASAVLIVAIAVASGSADEIGISRERQAAVRADTAQLARRIGTMLRVMDHYRLDEAAARRLLEEAAKTLDGLSREQMAAVMEKLDAAAATADADAARRLLDDAYTGHRDAVRQLRGLLDNFDSVRTLEESRARLDRAARAQLELAFRLSDILAESVAASRGAVGGRIHRAAEFPTVRAMREAEEQHDQGREVETTLKRIAALMPTLPDSDRRQAQRAQDFARDSRLLDRLATLPRLVKSDGTIPERQDDWRRAAELQWHVTTELQFLAHQLRPKRDRLQTLTDARKVLASAVLRLAECARGTIDLVRQPAGIGDKERPELSPEEAWLQRARRLADDLGRRAFAVSDVNAVLGEDAATTIEPHLNRAIGAFRGSEAALRHSSVLSARVCQSWADTQLRAALRELDLVIAMLERERRDPLAALDAALARIDKLIADQVTLRDNTDGAKLDAQRSPPLAALQQKLALRGDELARTPLPTADVVKQVLTDAVADMDAAVAALMAKQFEPALSKQQEAIVRYRAARLHLERDRANVARRRAEVAKLTAAKKQLAELTTRERRIAEAAAAANPDTSALAAEQVKHVDPANGLARDLESIAPEAARETSSSAADMNEAVAEFRQRRAPEGAAKAQAAADKLSSASNQVAKALRQRQAQEAFDQARLRPHDVDAAQAARDVAKALNSAEDATKNSSAAAQSPMAEHLLHLQKEIAEKAGRIGNNAAAEPAGRAAADIAKGALRDAVPNQQSALDQLKKDGQPEPTTAAHLAQQQKLVIETTQALLKANERNDMARSAVEQALAQAPDAVKNELNEAAKELRKAGENLQKSQPQQAGAAQAAASQSLEEALEALKAAADEWEKHAGQQPSSKRNNNPRQPPKNEKDGPSGDRSDSTVSSGEKPSDGYSQNQQVRLSDAAGEGSFVHLPPRQRELIRQAITDRLPPEYAAAIQQYYVNIARGKPAAKPGATPPVNKK